MFRCCPHRTPGTVAAERLPGGEWRRSFASVFTEQDTRTADARTPSEAEGAVAVPHERDESPEVAGTRSPVVAQAAADLEAGRVDTDNYTRAAEASGFANRRRGRRK
jgi:hypothetical protein